MPKAPYCGLPHSESEVYYGKSSAIGLTPLRSPDSISGRAEYDRANFRFVGHWQILDLTAFCCCNSRVPHHSHLDFATITYHHRFRRFQVGHLLCRSGSRVFV